MTTSLRAIVDLLRSEKQTQRQQGLDGLIAIASNEGHDSFAALEGRDAKGWNVLFQGLFTSVVLEKRHYLQKGDRINGEHDLSGPTSAASLKLEKAGTALKEMTSFSYDKIEMGTVNLILDHILQILPLRKKSSLLTKPLAFGYLRSLQVLLGYRPHLSRLNGDDWKRIYDLCWATLLGVDDDLEFGEPVKSNNLEVPLKRKRQGSILSGESRRINLPTQLESCLFEILELLAKASDRSVIKCGGQFFSNYLEWFNTTKQEVSSHLFALKALKTTLIAGAVNNVVHLQSNAAAFFARFQAFWQTKSQVLKEEMMVVSTILWPFLASQGDIHMTRRTAFTYWRMIVDDVEMQRGTAPLDLDYIMIHDKEFGMGPFITDELVPGHLFSQSHAFSWITIRLATSCLACLACDGQSTGQPKSVNQTTESLFLDEVSQPEPNHSAFTKTTDPDDSVSIQAVIKEVTSPVTTPKRRLIHLQALLFLLTDDTSFRERVDPLVLIPLMILAEDSSIASWTCLLLSKCQIEPVAAEVWTSAMRLLANPATCRAACHLLTKLMNSPALPRQRILSDLKDFTENLLLTGPGLLADSVCRFMQQVDHYISSTSLNSGDYHLRQLYLWLGNSLHNGEIDTCKDVSSLLFDTDLGNLVLLSTSATSMRPRTLPCPFFSSIVGDLSHWYRQDSCLQWLLRYKYPSSAVQNGMALHSTTASAFRPRPYAYHLFRTLAPRMLRAIRPQADRALSIATEADRIVCIALIALIGLRIVLSEAETSEQQRIEATALLVQTIAALNDALAQADPQQRPWLRVAYFISGATESNLASLSTIATGLARIVQLCKTTLLNDGDQDTSQNIQADDLDMIGTRLPERETATKPSLNVGQSRSEYHLRFLTQALCLLSVDLSPERDDLSSLSEFGCEILSMSEAEEKIICFDALVSALELLLARKKSIRLSDDKFNVLFKQVGNTLLSAYQCNRMDCVRQSILKLLQLTFPVWQTSVPITRSDSCQACTPGHQLLEYFTNLAGDFKAEGSAFYETICHLLGFLLSQKIACKLKLPFGKGKSADGAAIITGFLSSQDIRTREAAAHYIKELFICQSNGSDRCTREAATANHTNIYRSVCVTLETRFEIYEGIMSRIHVLSELATASDLLSSGVYYNLLEIADDSIYCSAVASAFDHLCKSLGLSSRTELFSAFKSQVVYSSLSFGQPDIKNIPLLVTGYENVLAYRRSIADEVQAQSISRDCATDADQFLALIKSSNHQQKSRWDLSLAYTLMQFHSHDEPSRVAAGRVLADSLIHRKDLWKHRSYWSASVVCRLAYDAEHDRKYLTKILQQQISDPTLFKALRDTLNRLPQILDGQQPLLLASALEQFRGTAKSMTERALSGMQHADEDCSTDQDTLLIAIYHVAEQFLSSRLHTTQSRQLRGMLHLFYILPVKCNSTLARFLLSFAASTLQEPHLVEDALYIGFIGLMSAGNDADSQLSAASFLADAIDRLKSGYDWLEPALQASLHHLENKKARRVLRDVALLANTKSPPSFSRSHPLISETLHQWCSPRTLLKDAIRIARRVRSWQKRSALLETVTRHLRDCDDLADRHVEVDSRSDHLTWLSWVTQCLEDDQCSEAYRNVANECLTVLRDVLKSDLPLQSLDMMAHLFSFRSMVGDMELEVKKWMMSQLCINTCSQDIRDSVLALDILRRVAQDVSFEHHPENEAVLRAAKRHPLARKLDVPLSILETLATEEQKPSSELRSSLFQGLCNFLSLHDQTYGAFAYFKDAISTSLDEMIMRLVLLSLRREISNPEGPRIRKHLSKLFQKYTSTTAEDNTNTKFFVRLWFFLLRQELPSTSLYRHTCHWLDVDLLDLAQAASRAGLYACTQFILEIDRDVSLMRGQGPGRLAKRLVPILDRVYGAGVEPDSFYGTQMDSHLDHLLATVSHESRWEKVQQIYCARIEAGSDTEGLGSLARVWRNDSLVRLASRLEEPQRSCNDFHYAAAWRTGTWDLPIAQSDDNREFTQDAVLYSLLRRMQQQDPPSLLRSWASKGAAAQLSSLIKVGPEDEKKMCQIFESHRNLADIAKSLNFIEQPNQNLHLLEQSLQNSLTPPLIEFWAVALSILDTTATASGNLTDRDGSSLQLREMIVRLYLRVSRVELDHGSFQAALVYYQKAHDRSLKIELNHHDNVQLQSQGAALVWLSGQHRLAVTWLSELAATGNLSASETMQMLTTLGDWASISKLEEPSEIVARYYLPAVQLAEKLKKPDNNARAFHAFGVYAATQYEALRISPEHHRLQILVASREAEIEQYDSNLARITQVKADKERQELQANKSKAHRLLVQEKQALQTYDNQLTLLLSHALVNLARTLIVCDEHDDDAYKFVSLWLSHATDRQVNRVVQSMVANIPSAKFVFLVYQLTSRLEQEHSHDTDASHFQALVARVVTLMTEDHPFHTLYQLLAIKTSPSAGQTTRRASFGYTAAAGRVEAAQSILEKVKAPLERKFGRIVEGMSRLCDLFIIICQSAIRRPKSTAPIPFPASWRFHDTDLGGAVPVPTVHLEVDGLCKYDNMICIQAYRDTFTLAGGLNMPKILTCLANNGEEYRQLFKGNDDTRQDAVMQQIYTLASSMLSKDVETRKRNLVIRTYKVVPLAPQAGILEFVANTVPMSSWLVPAHQKYRPEEMTPANGREELMKTLPPDEKIAVYRTICTQITPVMRYFNIEKFPIPSQWARARFVYSRSVATTSMIGHILGIGDRHTSNILLDTSTGEVVHIDFGYAFEQAKGLLVPELVPFRLTRDMVDAMGFTGVEGVFRRCCEHSLRVFGLGGDVILTILEVFKFDPLFNWTVSKIKAKRFHSSLSGQSIISSTAGPTRDESGEADRAITQVSAKLKTNLSIEYNVNELIRQAKDENNLALMFGGWQAHL